MLGDDVLKVRMLGEFSMTWNGQEICSGSKSSDAQFTRLLQLLLHNRKEGIERTKLQSLLFDDSNSDDVHHLLRTVMYNTRKKLRCSGLPDVQYIEFRQGRYYWTGEIPVQIDTEAFEELYAAAAEEKDEDLKLKKLMEAISAYKGNFLPNQTRLTWVAAEESRYKAIFEECVEEAAELLRKNSDYDGIEKLGRKASVACPLNDWEYLILEAYVFNGRIREAQDLYERTLDYYQKKLGIETVAERAEHVGRFLELSDRQYSDIGDIVRQLDEDRQPVRGGYYCSYPVFLGIYRMLSRSETVIASEPYLILCSVKRTHSRNERNIEKYERYTELAKGAICRAADSETVICRYCNGQFLIMLLSGSEESCRDLEDRIRSCYKKDGCSDELLSFSVSALER